MSRAMYPGAPRPSHLHDRFVNKGRFNEKYKLFGCAWDGCLPCCRSMIETGVVSFNAISDNCGYNALDFAVWAASCRGQDITELEAYLRGLGLRLKDEQLAIAV